METGTDKNFIVDFKENAENKNKNTQNLKVGSLTAESAAFLSLSNASDHNETLRKKNFI